MDLQGYLAFRCSQMLKMERDILAMNNMMAEEVKTPRLKEMLQQHAGPTQQQISTLEQVVRQLGGESEEQQGGVIGQVTEALGMEGQGSTPITKAMMQEHQQFLSMKPSQELIDLNDALEGDKVEHLEIASYTGLMNLAKHMGRDDIAHLLQQNLQGEQEMRSRIEANTATLFSEITGQGRKAA
ncbi:MAG: YciE/YciF ferroxidase family protein [Armatimonadota bacterium]